MLQLTSVQKQRHARKSRQKPEQAELFEAVIPLAPAPKPPAPPPAPVAQSPHAAKIAAETTMQAEARRTLAKKATGKAKAAPQKPRVQKCKP